jgi:hypothetical protein
LLGSRPEAQTSTSRVRSVVVLAKDDDLAGNARLERRKATRQGLRASQPIILAGVESSQGDVWHVLAAFDRVTHVTRGQRDALHQLIVETVQLLCVDREVEDVDAEGSRRAE